ncbi:MAG: M48 family metallopeptidase [Thermoguttaceae bacterium]
MDFFQHQDFARRRTQWLVFLYALALLLLMLAFYGLGILIISLCGGEEYLQDISYFDPTLLLAVIGGVLLLVGGGSLFKIVELANGGGDAVAEQLGGRLVSTTTQDPGERRLLNIVEEMAIAAGISIPKVYLLDHEEHINAFAAGFTPNTAAIGITRGAIDYLNRDELQGVVAHEFSHILNGDMRLNIRIIGILFGLNVLVVLGYAVLRMSLYANVGRSKNSDSNVPVVAITMIIGLGCVIIGSIGMLLSSLIQAAISRQREFLADASAVQFTRNPEGIANALKKIGAPQVSSTIENPNAFEASHLFFANIFGSASLANLFATHPPLAERIRRIDPHFDGNFATSVPRVRVADEKPSSPLRGSSYMNRSPSSNGSRTSTPSSTLSASTMSATGHSGDIAVHPAEMLQRMGQLNQRHLAVAAGLLESIPLTTLHLTRESFGARAVLYALLLDNDPAIQKKQIGILQSKLDTANLNLVLQQYEQFKDFPIASKTVLVQKALPALRQLSRDQYTVFRQIIEQLVSADQRIDLFEYTLRGLLLNDLDIHFGLIPGQQPLLYHSTSAVAQSTIVLLSVLAYSGSDDSAEIQRAFDLGLADFRISGSLLPQSACSFAAFDSALKTFVQSSPALKKRLLSAVMSCIAADGVIVVREGELIRAIAATLGCPLPPFSETVLVR